MNNTPTLQLAKQLMACPSLTPDDAGCQAILVERLKKLGFTSEMLSHNNVSNLWARYGTEGPLLVFAGHTDVVPTGPLDAWQSDPFIPTIREGFLYGRGAADMKSGLAAMIIAAESFISTHPEFKGSIAFLVTSDEEGPSIDGTKYVVDILKKRQEKLDYCIIGEATSIEHIGDQIRIGRRGSLHGNLTIHGKQGHVAFPEKARNPIHLVSTFLHKLTTEIWDQGNDFFPPTTFQISNIHSGTGASNVIPGTLNMQFNFRFGTVISPEEIKSRVDILLKQYNLDFTLKWEISGYPFLTPQGKLIRATQTAIKKITGQTPQLSTGGGTSDGRFIATLGTEVIELGPCHHCVHQINEHVKISDLEVLTQTYVAILDNIFLKNT